MAPYATRPVEDRRSCDESIAEEPSKPLNEATQLRHGYRLLQSRWRKSIDFLAPPSGRYNPIRWPWTRTNAGSLNESLPPNLVRTKSSSIDMARL